MPKFVVTTTFIVDDATVTAVQVKRAFAQGYFAALLGLDTNTYEPKAVVVAQTDSEDTVIVDGYDGW